jgi:hypothetical protein
MQMDRTSEARLQRTVKLLLLALAQLNSTFVIEIDGVILIKCTRSPTSSSKACDIGASSATEVSFMQSASSEVAGMAAAYNQTLRSLFQAQRGKICFLLALVVRVLLGEFVIGTLSSLFVARSLGHFWGLRELFSVELDPFFGKLVGGFRFGFRLEGSGSGSGVGSGVMFGYAPGRRSVGFLSGSPLFARLSDCPHTLSRFGLSQTV